MIEHLLVTGENPVCHDLSGAEDLIGRSKIAIQKYKPQCAHLRLMQQRLLLLGLQWHKMRTGQDTVTCV